MDREHFKSTPTFDPDNLSTQFSFKYKCQGSKEYSNKNPLRVKDNKATRSPEIYRQQVQKLTPQYFFENSIKMLEIA